MPGPPSKEVPVVRGYFGLGAESGTKETRFECKEHCLVWRFVAFSSPSFLFNACSQGSTVKGSLFGFIKRTANRSSFGGGKPRLLV